MTQYCMSLSDKCTVAPPSPSEKTDTALPRLNLCLKEQECHIKSALENGMEKGGLKREAEEELSSGSRSRWVLSK